MIGLWYTHSIYAVRTSRGPVVPIWFEFPEVEALHRIELEVLLGDSLLIAPVVDENVSSIYIEKPPGLWYNFSSGEPLHASGNVSVTMDGIPVYIRGGRIVPRYENPVNNTIDTIVTPLTLIIACDENGRAEGSLYLDDGITFNCTEGEFLHRYFVFEEGKLHWKLAEPTESRIPEFLKKAIVHTITIYNQTAVRNVTNLTLHVAHTWTWPERYDSGGRSSDSSRGAVSAFVMLVTVIIIFAGAVVYGMIMGRKRHDSAESRPLLKEYHLSSR
jgi:alpha-glucosidase (family GH31 glycosyl hydrolase)